jgi:hypothetical protein
MPAEYFKLLGIEEPSNSGNYFIGLRAFLKDHARIASDQFDAVFDQASRAWERPWTAKDYPQIAAWLKANEKPLVVAIEATKRPDYFNPLVRPKSKKEPVSLLDARLASVEKCREIARCLGARAMLRVEEGRIDEAWQDLLACHRLSLLLSRGGTIIEALVGIAVDQLASNAELAYLERAKLSAQQVKDRLKDLLALPSPAPLRDKFELGERFMFLDSLQMIRRGAGVAFLEGLPGRKAGKPSAEKLKALNMIDWGPALRNGNRWYDRLSAAARIQDRAARVKEFDKIDEEIKTLYHDIRQSPSLKTKVTALAVAVGFPDKVIGKGFGDALISYMMPASSKVQSVWDRSAQVNRNLHIAFALAAYQRDNGRYPAKLEDLAPKYLVAVPDDLFMGKALVYRPAASGYLLYSVGINGEDEGGRTCDDKPAGDDLRVKMPLPELCREK